MMNAQAARILVVEDELEIRRFVFLSLTREGFKVFEAGGVKDGLAQAQAHLPNLLILDLGLPDGDGMDLIQVLRKSSDAPILVLSARTAEAEKVAALNVGADDYLVKPFGVAELVARVRAQLRRRPEGLQSNTTVLEFGAIRMDLIRRVVERSDQPVHLTPIEYKLLNYLVARPERLLTHRQILKEVWGDGHAEDTHYLRVYMGHLRKKIEIDPSRPEHLLTETGLGYRFIP